MGKQEYWIDDFKMELKKYGVKLAIGSGGTFEFVSGIIKRSPLIIQKCGLEGLWRLIREPKLFRLMRLYISFKILYYFIIDLVFTKRKDAC